RHRLLAQPCPACELAHAQAVLFEQRHQDRAVARPHLAPAGGAEPLLQELVPALRRLGEQKAEIVPIHGSSYIRLVLLSPLVRRGPAEATAAGGGGESWKRAEP